MIQAVVHRYDAYTPLASNRGVRSLRRTHDNFGPLCSRDADRGERLKRAIGHVIESPPHRRTFLCLRAIAIRLIASSAIKRACCAFLAQFCALGVITGGLIAIIYVCTHTYTHVVGINRAKRGALLLHVGSQFLYLDNQ